jgi:hypothetical protein
MAVAAFSSRRNFPNIRALSNFDEDCLARQSCRYYNQKRKIAALSKYILEANAEPCFAACWFQAARRLTGERASPPV